MDECRDECKGQYREASEEGEEYREKRSSITRSTRRSAGRITAEGTDQWPTHKSHTLEKESYSKCMASFFHPCQGCDEGESRCPNKCRRHALHEASEEHNGRVVRYSEAECCHRKERDPNNNNSLARPNVDEWSDRYDRNGTAYRICRVDYSRG